MCVLDARGIRAAGNIGRGTLCKEAKVHTYMAAKYPAICRFTSYFTMAAKYSATVLYRPMVARPSRVHGQ